MVKIINVLGAEIISNMLISFFLEILTKENLSINDKETPGIPTISAFEKFGTKLLNRYIYDQYVKSEVFKNNESLSFFKYLNSSEYEETKEDIFCGKLGGHFVGSLLEIDLLYQDLDVKNDTVKEKEYYLRIDKNIRSLLLKSSNKFLHTPQKLPMICKPKEFVYSLNEKENKLGGYLLNDIYYTDEIFKNKKGYEEITKLTEDNIIVGLINGLSAIPYRINTDTLEFIKLYGFEKQILTDNSDEKLQKFMENPYSSNLTKTEKNKYRSIYSKIILESNILNISECYSNESEIYFPVRLDNRTRIYCETDYFDYQKSDLAKGLISFVNKGIISKVDTEAINYLKAYGCNMYGNNLEKKSINFKVK